MTAPTREELLELAVKQSMIISECHADNALLREQVSKLKQRVGELEVIVANGRSSNYFNSRLDWSNRIMEMDRKAIEGRVSEEKIEEQAKAWSVRWPHAVNNVQKEQP